MALRERGFSSLSGNKELTCRVAWPENYIKKMGTETSLVVSKEIPGLTSFRMDWLDLLAVQGSAAREAP